MQKISQGFWLFVGLAVLFSAPAVQAQEDYRSEISASYLNFDPSDDGTMYVYGASAELFFAPVSTAEHAYAEAAFLERAGSLRVGVQNQVDHSGIDKSDGPGIGVALTYAKAGFPLAIGASYSQTWIASGDSAGTDFEARSYGLRVGNYFTDSLLAGLLYSYSKNEFSSPGTPDSSTESNTYGIFARYAHELQGETSLSFEGELVSERYDNNTETLTNTISALDVDYYFSHKLSVGLGVANNTGEEEANEGMTYGARARYFFTPQVSLLAGYNRFLSANEGYGSAKTFSTTLAMRF